MSIFRSFDLFQTIAFCLIVGAAVFAIRDCGQEEEIAEGVAGAMVIADATLTQDSSAIVTFSDESKKEAGLVWFGYKDEDPAKVRAMVEEMFSEDVEGEVDITNPNKRPDYKDIPVYENPLEPGCGIDL